MTTNAVGLPAWVTSWHLLVGAIAALGVLEGAGRMVTQEREDS